MMKNMLSTNLTSKLLK